MTANDKDTMVERDANGIAALLSSVREYHTKYNCSNVYRPCSCGQSVGTSMACHGLAILLDLFKYADLGTAGGRERFEFVRKLMVRKTTEG